MVKASLLFYLFTASGAFGVHEELRHAAARIGTLPHQ
jgi:hypothetical protein